ncbi:MAG: UDP-N-acetylglucosamine 2-epimerase (non-hydrolyzing) [Candidatus Brocadiaceae bacterium]|nr:UDP-N-acetylglucosamine 2-epimerase (non-hydrolyzing) [Candidatus Brocadiaceae bacterium]
MKKVSVIFGTRPEAIKLAPVILRLRREAGFQVNVCVTGQHRDMLDQVLDVFEVEPDADLNLMRPDQGLAALTARMIEALDGYLGAVEPDCVLVQGDTTSALCGALAAFFRHIPVGHVEAGLRTGDMNAPWPEEANRVLVSRLAHLHFAPTEANRQNLLAEGVPSEHVAVTGNTVIDALLLAVDKVRRGAVPIDPALREQLQSLDGRRLVLLTAHRRESFGPGMRSICRGVRALASAHSDTVFIFPVHLNPHVREVVYPVLGELPNVRLLEPLDYFSFVGLLDAATLILTDSGGLQEEAPTLGKPVVVMREKTERSEGVAAGTAVLVGTDEALIIETVSRLLAEDDAYTAMARAVNPYGDGQASDRICRRLSIAGQGT